LRRGRPIKKLGKNCSEPSTPSSQMAEVIKRLHLENRRQVRMMEIAVLLECSEGRFHLNAQGPGFSSGGSSSYALRREKTEHFYKGET
jgi:hypothetical protein